MLIPCLENCSLFVKRVVHLLVPHGARQQRVGFKPAQEDGKRRKEQRLRLTHKRDLLCATCIAGEAGKAHTAIHAKARDHEAVVWEQRLRVRRRFCCQLHGTGVTTQHASYRFLVHQLVEDGEPVRRGRRTCRAALHRRRRHPGAWQAEVYCTATDTRHDRGTRREREGRTSDAPNDGRNTRHTVCASVGYAQRAGSHAVDEAWRGGGRGQTDRRVTSPHLTSPHVPAGTDRRILRHAQPCHVGHRHRDRLQRKHLAHVNKNASPRP